MGIDPIRVKITQAQNGYAMEISRDDVCRSYIEQNVLSLFQGLLITFRSGEETSGIGLTPHWKKVDEALDRVAEELGE